MLYCLLQVTFVSTRAIAVAAAIKKAGGKRKKVAQTMVAPLHHIANGTEMVRGPAPSTVHQSSLNSKLATEIYVNDMSVPRARANQTVRAGTVNDRSTLDDTRTSRQNSSTFRDNAESASSVLAGASAVPQSQLGAFASRRETMRGAGESQIGRESVRGAAESQLGAFAPRPVQSTLDRNGSSRIGAFAAPRAGRRGAGERVFGTVHETGQSQIVQSVMGAPEQGESQLGDSV